MTGTEVISAFLRVDLGRDYSVGPGKIALLEQIAAMGSLSAAARELRMSYRAAWLLLSALNSGPWGAVSVSATGGNGGGGVKLTPLGSELVRQFRAAEAETNDVAKRLLSFLSENAKTRTNPNKRVRVHKRP